MNRTATKGDTMAKTIGSPGSAPGSLWHDPPAWHESLDPHQFCIEGGPTTLRDPDTGEWRVELTYTFAGREYAVGGEDTTEKKALLRMLDSLKTSIEARHMVS